MAGLISLVVVLIFSLTFLGSDAQHEVKLRPAPVAPPDRRIEVGMHIKNIYNLSLKDKTFNADGWFWLKWPESIQQLLEADQIPIIQLVELENQVESYDSKLELDSNKPMRLEGGRYLQLFRFSAKFYDDHQNLRSFPFENLELPITVEVRPSQFSMGNQAVVLTPKLKFNELQGDLLTLNGYTLEGSKATSAIHAYQTTFGEEGSAKAGEFSEATFEVKYHTNSWASFYRFLLPWIAVMVILLLAPNLEGNLNDLRLAHSLHSPAHLGVSARGSPQQATASRLPHLSRQDLPIRLHGGHGGVSACLYGAPICTAAPLPKSTRW